MARESVVQRRGASATFSGNHSGRTAGGRHPGRRARVNGVDVDLTKREFDLLAVLAEHKTAVLSRAQLLELVWGYDFAADTNVVDVFIGYLRRKLEAGGAPRLPAHRARSRFRPAHPVIEPLMPAFP